MTVVTIKPNGDNVATTGVSPTGAATVWQALSDSSDSSYVDFDSYADVVRCTMEDVTLPTGGVLKSAQLAARCAYTPSSPGDLTARIYDGIGPTYTPVVTTNAVNWSTPTTIYSSLAALTNGVGVLNSALFDVYSTKSLRLYELSAAITYVAQPVAVVTNPTGAITTTNKPQAAWSTTLDSDGGTQTAYDVKVFSAAQYGAGGFDPATSTPTIASGITASSAATWQPTTTLADGTYRTYVRVGQTVNGTTFWSAWSYSAFTLAVDLPAAPTLTLTAENTGGRIKIDSIHNAGTATTTANEIQRSVDNVTWEPLRLTTDTNGVTYSPDATVYDYEAGNGQTVYYRARALHDYSGVFAASAWATANTSWSSTAWWLKCPLSPVLNTLVYPHAVESFTRRARQGIFQALGASEAIVVSDTREARTGQITLRLDTDEEIVALDALLDSGETLLLNAPAGDHFPDRYVALGDLDRERIADKAFIEGTLDSLQWTEVVVAAGVVDAWPTGLAPSETLAPSTSLAPAA